MKLGPPKLASQPFILLDSVVTEQWSATLPLVNPPNSLEYLSPGQCIRAAVVVDGNDNQKLISGVGIGFTVHLGQTQQGFPVAPPQATKHLKPEGYDVVAGALHAANVDAPDMSMASMAASAAKWCVPPDAPAGAVTVDVTATFQNKTSHLKPATLTIDSMTHPQVPFSTADNASRWIMTYYRDPRPALLVPVMSLLSPEQQASSNMEEFILAASRADPVAASLLGDQIAAAQRPTQLLLLNLLSKAGVRLVHPVVLNPDDQTILDNAPPLPDPYDTTINQQLFSKQDMLWADFFATGSVKPVQTLAGELTWRADYDAFDKMRKSGQHPAALTDSIIRGVAYTAAGWSLGSFDRTDPLAADYIEALEASPDTPPELKRELPLLLTDPAFQQPSKQ